MAIQYANGKIVTDGLVLCLNAADKNSYPGSGTTWTDISGNGNSGTLTNGPTFNSSGYFSFDGVDDFVDTSLNLNQTMTINMWYRRKKESTSGNNIIIHASAYNYPASSTWFDLNVGDPYYGSGGTIEIWAYSELNGSRQDFVISPYPASIYNRWRNICIVFNNSTGTAYMESTLIGSSTPAFTAWDTATTRVPLEFARGRFYEFNGGSYTYTQCDIAAIQVYNRALSATEILQNYNSQKSRFSL